MVLLLYAGAETSFERFLGVSPDRPERSNALGDVEACPTAEDLRRIYEQAKRVR